MIFIKYQYICILLKQLIIFFNIAAICSNYHQYRPTIDTITHSNNLFMQLYKQKNSNCEEVVRNFTIQAKIMNQYYNWKGVRYKLGGIYKSGIDCSAFVQRTFIEQFNIHIPRSTKDQKKIGIKVQRTKLLPGDLVLFSISATANHVGIYLGNDLFVHVSTSRGVIISNINNLYWKAYYYEGRRILTVK
ncbi:bifunctional murein DD-endopeptidase/murein LD-carboxypeptidase [Candidatus Palibaumannia cicadellinicola]|uniref:NlpC/P60 domain-containing protein n=1 Tax=Candidatus Palibaumannia cicadellinicola TaxID=186490 RepID=A0A0K2BL58_9GAMM|nr:bifunctional murein DD-endopeptidase/murein LD-carboxypeptidase [Candidatus Baumannia cicadellinicola]AKZ65934.1 hypothetical protein AB162_341 [Candidatus Baumannia cicadellinicola]